MSLNALSPKGREGVSREMPYVQIKYITDLEAWAIFGYLSVLIEGLGGRIIVRSGRFLKNDL